MLIERKTLYVVCCFPLHDSQCGEEPGGDQLKHLTNLLASTISPGDQTQCSEGCLEYLQRYIIPMVVTFVRVWCWCITLNLQIQHPSWYQTLVRTVHDHTLLLKADFLDLDWILITLENMFESKFWRSPECYYLFIVSQETELYVVPDVFYTWGKLGVVIGYLIW